MAQRIKPAPRLPPAGASPCGNGRIVLIVRPRPAAPPRPAGSCGPPISDLPVTDPAALLRFIDASPSPYHAILAAKALLEGAGFRERREGDRWTVEPGQAYFTVRGGKTIVAWRQGSRPVAEAGFHIVAAHSDSPVLKLRPRPGLRVGEVGYLTTAIYGSPLLHTWLDRDLCLAGAVYLADDGPSPRIVHAPDLKLRALSLAPHLRRGMKAEGLVIDMQKDLPLIFTEGAEDTVTQLFERLGFDQRQVLAFDLSLADTQPGALVGQAQSFISAPRLDNLFSTYCALSALVGTAADREHTSVAAIYDSEEIGSQTWTGAGSNVLDAVLQRLNNASGGDVEDLLRAKARSVLVSADMAHGEHPSFTEATDPVHVPRLNKGLAIKSGERGNYAMGHDAAAWFEAVCRGAGLTPQRFMYRCDHGGGSSVGPIISTGLGVSGVDVGAGMIGMHSIRELAGAQDVALSIRAFSAFLAAPGHP